MKKKRADASRELPLKLNDLLKATTVTAVCFHHPPCLSGEACLKRSVEYAMGLRLKP